MKLAKCLIFKINKQKFAIRTHEVFNIVEKPKLVNIASGNSFEKAIFSFRGMSIPLLNIRKTLGLSRDPKNQNKCILVIEMNLKGYPELVGISIDEVVEIAEIEDLLSYPYCSVSLVSQNDIRETIIIRDEESIVMLNPNNLFSKKVPGCDLKKQIGLLAN
jgi:purine-binding chemotaxis protein CheW